MYKVRIAVRKNGQTLIGARIIDSFGDIVDEARVFGSQIGCRCAALTPEGYRIMTPTAAKKQGFETTQEFAGPS
jgi:hypothetical protein